jgi:L-fuconolactonase
MALLMTTKRESPRVDAHQHFWRYSEAEYGWINEAMSAIRRDFLPGHLLPVLDEVGIDATIAVQARQTYDETHWLLELADENDWIAGVVGWVPLADPSAHETLEHFAAHSKLKGVRHVLQGEADAYMDRADFNAGVALLSRFGLTYDVLILEAQLPAAIQFVDRHPQQPMVLDHLAKPLIAAHQIEPWRTHVRDLARRPHVSCKLSGMVTEADFAAWTIEDLRPYVDTVLEAFGPRRLLFGSDWPVCTVAASYSRWVAAVRELIGELSEHEQDRILGRNAETVYNLSIFDNPHEVD